MINSEYSNTISVLLRLKKLTLLVFSFRKNKRTEFEINPESEKNSKERGLIRTNNLCSKYLAPLLPCL